LTVSRVGTCDDLQFPSPVYAASAIPGERHGPDPVWAADDGDTSWLQVDGVNLTGVTLLASSGTVDLPAGVRWPPRSIDLHLTYRLASGSGTVSFDAYAGTPGAFTAVIPGTSRATSNTSGAANTGAPGVTLPGSTTYAQSGPIPLTYGDAGLSIGSGDGTFWIAVENVRPAGLTLRITEAHLLVIFDADTPPLRQRQRDDGLGRAAPRQRSSGVRPSSRQRSIRQGWRGTYL